MFLIRNKINNIMVQSALSFFFKSACIAITFLSASLIIKKIGVEGYGEWAAYYSMVAWGVALDFGIGSALINRFNRNANLDIYLTVSALIIYSFLFTLLFFLLSIFVENKNVLYWMCVFIIALPGFSVFDKYCISAQKGYKIEFIQLIIISLLVTCVYLGWSDSIFSLVTCFISITIMVRILFIFDLFKSISKKGNNKSPVFPLNKYRLFKVAAVLIRESRTFLFLQIFAVFLLSLERFIVLKLFSAEICAMYDLVARVFMVILVFSNLFSRNLWGVVASANNKGEFSKSKFKQMHDTLVKYFASLLIGFILLSSIIPIGIRIWVDVDVPLSITIALALWTFIQTCLVTVCNIMNGLKKQNTQLPFLFVAVIAKFVLLLVVMYSDFFSLEYYICISSILLLPYVIYSLYWFKKNSL
jgi:O-antigen/teichoic acid export membrane protein